jgi:hypothetical protein
MADRAQPLFTHVPADSKRAEASPDTEAFPTPENSERMLNVHASRESIHTWKDFFIHIATICVGLLIALGLEQTVERSITAISANNFSSQ